MNITCRNNESKEREMKVVLGQHLQLDVLEPERILSLPCSMEKTGILV